MEKQEGRVQDIVMRYKYKVRELTDDVKHVTRESTKQILNNHQYSDMDTVSNVGEEKEMEAMSFKKLKAKLDHKKEYASRCIQINMVTLYLD